MAGVAARRRRGGETVFDGDGCLAGGNGGQAGIHGSITGIHTPNNVAVYVFDSGIKKLVAVDVYPAFIAAERNS